MQKRLRTEKFQRQWKPAAAKAYTEIVILRTLVAAKAPLRWRELAERTCIASSSVKLRVKELIKRKIIIRTVVADSGEYPPPVTYRLNESAPLTPTLKLAYFEVLAGIPEYFETLLPRMKIGEDVWVDSSQITYWNKIHMAIHAFIIAKAIGFAESISDKEQFLFKLLADQIAFSTPLIQSGHLIHMMGYGWDVKSSTVIERPSQIKEYGDWIAYYEKENSILNFLYDEGQDIANMLSAPTRIHTPATEEFKEWLKSRHEEYKKVQSLK